MNPADELVDVIDDAGHTISVVTRREMRQQRLPHRCVYLLVFNMRGELFIHQRTAAKDVYPAHWDVTVSGVLAAGEDFDGGAVREAREEIGVDVEPERLFRLQYADPATVAHGMVYRAIHDGPFRLQVEEIVRGEFVALEDLPQRIGATRSVPMAKPSSPTICAATGCPLSTRSPRRSRIAPSPRNG